MRGSAHAAIGQLGERSVLATHANSYMRSQAFCGCAVFGDQDGWHFGQASNLCGIHSSISQINQNIPSQLGLRATF